MHKWGNGERLLLAACVGLSFSRYLRPKNNDQKRGKKKRPVPTASTAGFCLSVVSFGDAPVPKVSRHLQPSQLFPGGYAGVRLSYGTVFQQISDNFKWKERGGGKEGRYGIDKRS